MGRDNGISRAVADDDTALLLSAVESFRNEALGRLRKGSEASRILDQEMSTRLLHLACRHDAVECVRLLLDGGHGITAALVDARDQLMRTPLHIAAETHSARCIQLLLSRNARTDLRVVDGRPLIALEVALFMQCFLFRVQVDWSLDNSLDDLLASRYAMEGRVAALAMLLLVVPIFFV